MSAKAPTPAPTGPTLSPHVTRPAREGGRYDLRTPAGAPSPERALADSRSVGLLRHHPWFEQDGLSPADVCVSDVGEVVLVFVLLRNYLPEGEADVAVTCYDARTVADEALQGALHAIAWGGDSE